MKRFLLNALLLILLAGCSMESQLAKYVDVHSPITIINYGRSKILTPDSVQHKKIVQWIYMNPKSWKKIKNQTYLAFDVIKQDNFTDSKNQPYVTFDIIKQDNFTLLLNWDYDWCLINFIDDNKIVKQYSRSISNEEINNFLIPLPPIIDGPCYIAPQDK
jgi:hypothetical protein